MFANSTVSDRYSNSPKRKHDKIEAAPDCPRCLSSNTKFCYYNNYNLSQPRYFCKACRRYWTKGGSLRNVPVGGGCRKRRRARQSAGYTTPTLGTGSADESNGGACIDMAAVFAKYVEGHSEIEESYGAGDSSGSSENAQESSTFDVDSRLEDLTTSFDCQKPLDLINVGELSTFQQLVVQDCNRLEMEVQGVLCDELSPDILWPEGTSLLPSFGLQELMVQGGDCGLFAPDDDQLRISGSLVTEHWGYYDISEYDFY